MILRSRLRLRVLVGVLRLLFMIGVAWRFRVGRRGSALGMATGASLTVVAVTRMLRMSRMRRVLLRLILLRISWLECLYLCRLVRFAVVFRLWWLWCRLIRLPVG